MVALEPNRLKLLRNPSGDKAMVRAPEACRALKLNRPEGDILPSGEYSAPIPAGLRMNRAGIRFYAARPPPSTAVLDDDGIVLYR